jgi:hypothetical protein
MRGIFLLTSRGPLRFSGWTLLNGSAQLSKKNSQLNFKRIFHEVIFGCSRPSISAESVSLLFPHLSIIYIHDVYEVPRSWHISSPLFIHTHCGVQTTLSCLSAGTCKIINIKADTTKPSIPSHRCPNVYGLFKLF